MESEREKEKSPSPIKVKVVLVSYVNLIPVLYLEVGLQRQDQREEGPVACDFFVWFVLSRMTRK